MNKQDRLSLAKKMARDLVYGGTLPQISMDNAMLKTFEESADHYLNLFYRYDGFAIGESVSNRVRRDLELVKNTKYENIQH